MSTPRKNLVLRADMERPERVPFAAGEAVLYSASSPMRPGGNEDGAVLCDYEGRGFLGVADGMGGTRAGDVAAQLCIEALASGVRFDEIRPSLVTALETANDAILDRGVGSMTTAVVAAIEADTVQPIHVGDSQLLVVGQRGKIRFQTLPHSPVGYAVEAGLLDEEDAMFHEDRHLVANAIGIREMRIEIGPPQPMRPRDTVVLASDGLFDNLSIAEVADIVRTGDLLESAQVLVDACRRRMSGVEPSAPCKPDDLTFVLYRAPREPQD